MEDADNDQLVALEPVPNEESIAAEPHCGVAMNLVD
jgi:hypothetical protein